MTDSFSIKAAASNVSSSAAQVASSDANTEQQIATIKFNRETLYSSKPTVVYSAQANKHLVCAKAFNQDELAVYEQHLDIMYSQKAVEVLVLLRTGHVTVELFAKRGNLSAYTQAKDYAVRMLRMFKEDVICIDIVANRS